VSGCYAGQFVAVQGPLCELAEGFVELLWGRGYSPRTVETQMRMVRDLSAWLERHDVGLAALDGAVIAAYVSVRRRRTPTLRSERGLEPLLGYLRDLGVIPAAEVAGAADEPSRIMAGFEEYLRSRRGVSEATVRSYLSQVRPFVVSVEPGGWGSVTAEQANRFIDEKAAIHKPRSVQVRINALRSLLRWLWLERLIALPLYEQVQSMFAPAGPAIPRGLTSSEVTALHRALSADPVARLRDTALVGLMLRLGLRAGEAASLRLEDIDWRAGTLTVAGKAGRSDTLPLPADVGEALVAYLRAGRPVGSPYRQVFVSVDAPHVPIKATAVTSMVGQAIRLAGITGTGAAHRLRHSAAMGVIAAGGGLIEAGQLLRHSSVTATAIYARADVTALAALARPWPEVTQ
jgi:integrase/recombinase XerD